MVKLNFAVTGVEKVLQKMDAATVDKQLADSIKKITMWFHSTVMTSTPVVNSRLRSSISSMITPTSGRVFTNIEYAPFVEYGTKRMEARHVEKGSSTRRLGKGPFTYTLEQLEAKMESFIGEMGKAIKARFE